MRFKDIFDISEAEKATVAKLLRKGKGKAVRDPVARRKVSQQKRKGVRAPVTRRKREANDKAQIIEGRNDRRPSGEALHRPTAPRGQAKGEGRSGLDVKKGSADLAAFRRDANAAAHKEADDKVNLRFAVAQARADEQTAVAQLTHLEQKLSTVQLLFEDEKNTKDALAMALKKANDGLVTLQRDADDAGKKAAENKTTVLRSELAHARTSVFSSARAWASSEQRTASLSAALFPAAPA
eukprot:jgi/Undpi1/13389/HiC_scaffold_8.g03048.m1